MLKNIIRKLKFNRNYKFSKKQWMKLSGIVENTKEKNFKDIINKWYYNKKDRMSVA